MTNLKRTVFALGFIFASSAQAYDYSVIAKCTLPVGAKLTSVDAEMQENLSYPNPRFTIEVKESESLWAERFATLVAENFPGVQTGSVLTDIPAGRVALTTIPINSIGTVLGGGESYELNTTAGTPFSIAEERPGKIVLTLKSIPGHDLQIDYRGKNSVRVNCEIWGL